MTGIEAAFPPPHWSTITMQQEYKRTCDEYRKVWTVMPEQSMADFERADILLKDAQDLRDALEARGVEVPGVLLP